METTYNEMGVMDNTPPKVLSGPQSVIPFNGGKINHIFSCTKGLYEDSFSSQAAKRCFENPASIVSLKVHGECCLLKRQEQSDGNFVWTFFTRFDTKGKALPTNSIHLPSGVQPASYENHLYCFIPLEKSKVVGKGSKKSFVGHETYSAIDEGVSSGDIPDANGSNCPDFITVEWVGKKHQGNIDNLTVDHGLYIHGSLILDIPMRSYESMKKMAQTLSIEGLIFYDVENGERFKVRFDMFENSMFTINCKLPIGPETTTIKPKVIAANL
jgi:hypothetical protein